MSREDFAHWNMERLLVALTDQSRLFKKKSPTAKELSPAARIALLNAAVELLLENSNAPTEVDTEPGGIEFRWSA